MDALEREYRELIRSFDLENLYGGGGISLLPDMSHKDDFLQERVLNRENKDGCVGYYSS